MVYNYCKSGTYENSEKMICEAKIVVGTQMISKGLDFDNIEIGGDSKSGCTLFACSGISGRKEKSLSIGYRFREEQVETLEKVEFISDL